MKTNFERQFEKLMICHISYIEVTPEDRAHYFWDFYVNEAAYYDNFCDLLYASAMGVIEDPLWLTPSGNIYSDQASRKSEDICLMTSDDLPVFADDIADQVEAAFLCLYKLHQD